MESIFKIISLGRFVSFALCVCLCVCICETSTIVSLSETLTLTGGSEGQRKGKTRGTMLLHTFQLVRTQCDVVLKGFKLIILIPTSE